MPTIYKVDEGEGTRSKSGKRLSGEGGTNETGCVKRETVVLSVTPVLLPGKSHGWRSLVGYSPWGLEESNITERLHFHAWEKEMATHSSVLAWRVPGMEKPVGCHLWGCTESDATEAT